MTKLTRENDSIVYVVDDDDSLREALAALLRVVGLKVECFDSAQDFLQKSRQDVAGAVPAGALRQKVDGSE